jgi:hypothetical protein
LPFFSTTANTPSCRRLPKNTLPLVPIASDRASSRLS